jgi:thiamine-phosphate pyrophosphorylase
MSTAPRAVPALMYITNRHLLGDGPVLIERVRAAMWRLPAGSILLHIREPSMTAKEVVELCERLVPIAHDAGQSVVLNDRLDLAMHVEADGVHLPVRGLSTSEARTIWPSGLLGKSCHDEAELEAASGADYITVAPIFATESKPGHAGLGLDLLRSAATRFVAFGLGGVDAKNAATVLSSGAHGVAMMRGAWI